MNNFYCLKCGHTQINGPSNNNSGGCSACGWNQFREMEKNADTQRQILEQLSSIESMLSKIYMKNYE